MSQDQSEIAPELVRTSPFLSSSIPGSVPIIKISTRQQKTSRELEAPQEENQGPEVPGDTIVVDTSFLQTEHLEPASPGPEGANSTLDSDTEPETPKDTVAVKPKGYIAQGSQRQNSERILRARKRINYVLSANTGIRIPRHKDAIILEKNKAPLTITPYHQNGVISQLKRKARKITNSTHIEESYERTVLKSGTSVRALKLKDNRGNPTLCYNCYNTASLSNEAVIPYRYCSLSCHLDHQDIPLAKEPPPSKAWRYPAHIDDLFSQSQGLGSARKFRKITDTSAIEPVVSHGFKNNGHIEIENPPTDDEDEGSGFFEQKEYGCVYRLPEEGIKLDFISRVHREFGEYSQRDISKKLAPKPPSSPPQPNPFTIYSLDEQQAALNLLYLANSNPNISVTQNLIDTLIAKAPEPVIKLIAQGDASKFGPNARVEDLSKSDKSSLLAMKQLLRCVVVSIGASRTDIADGET
ncbi:phd-finger domain-containing protein [Rutstroemia sp. NJR-2017a BBW]|nr:phd-finger domain-containing protein [Rutstroemia sp. NJR-2017a BBW]